MKITKLILNNFSSYEGINTFDLSNEENIRNVIRDVSKLAGKPIDRAQEDNIVREIMKNGVNDNLFNML